MTQDKEILIQYATNLARPHFCEVSLSRFLTMVQTHATSKEDVDQLYWEFRHGAKEKIRAKKIRTIELD